jgi:thiaminase/transcriptional activator TenA
MTRFSDEARHRTQALRAAIATLPFNTGLAAGTLARARFEHYITQDALYLGQFSRALAIAAAKAPDTATLQSFAQSALGAVAVEHALHEHYLLAFGVDPASLAAAEPAPDCLAYTSFLLATAYHEPWEVLVAALLPCFWIYWDVGCGIAASAAGAAPDNPYRAWIDTYADPRFGEAVAAVVATADHAADAASAAVRGRMLAAFIRATQYEYLFWDGAYHRRLWPPVG